MLKIIQSAINKELDSGRPFHEIQRRWRDCVVYCAMNKCEGHPGKAAVMLKVGRNTLDLWLREMRQAGLKTSEYEPPKAQRLDASRDEGPSGGSPSFD